MRTKQEYCIIHNRKKLANNKNVKLLGFWNELYIAESMCIENQQLFYRCCKLKALKKSCLCWFFNSFFLFWNELYIAESMRIENQQLFYRCCKLKALKKSCLCWFFNSFFLFWNELYIAESMRIENQQLFYRCCKLKALEINILSICVSISYHWCCISA